MQTLLLLLTATLLAGEGTKDSAQADLEKLQGHWVLVAETVGGVQVPREMIEGRRLQIQGNRYMFKSPVTGGEKGTFRIDPSTKPRRIDGTPSEGPHKGETRYGLYEIQGDTLRFCITPIGQPRPSDLVSTPNSKIILVTYQRTAVNRKA